MSVYDFCRACGEPGAQIALWSAQYPIITDQRFIPVECKTSGGGGGGTEPQPTEPETKLLLLKLIATVEELKQGQDAQTQALQKAIADLKAEVEKGIKIRW